MSAEPYPLQQPPMIKSGKTSTKTSTRMAELIFLCNVLACLVYVIMLVRRVDEHIMDVLAATSVTPEYVLIKKEL